MPWNQVLNLAYLTQRKIPCLSMMVGTLVSLLFPLFARRMDQQYEIELVEKGNKKENTTNLFWTSHQM